MTPTPLPRQQTLPLTPIRRPSAELFDSNTPYHWECPTLAEFVRRVEHEFGNSFSPTGLYRAGIAPNELLPPNTVRAFCEQLGVPPEDFGV